jgi:Protein of unknown function (DUF3617)
MPMRLKVALAVLVTSALALWAADTITPLDVKLGLWQMTVTHSMSGMPALPADTLAKMSPEQRSRFEAAMKQSGSSDPTTNVHKECVTKEKLDKESAFGDDRKNCTRTVVSSSSRKLEVKLHCEEERGKTDGTLLLEVVSSDSVKGSMHSVTSFNGRNVNMDFTFDSKYLGSDCGDVK